ncbi:hypothetical protein ZIOFF_054912 [Zingiber officinale]|uniref:Plant heme peroxidase family profile domain-containing protein n=1 Tax=Zingiber officinale TaxID=94328 RepID=A0A8J5FF27_ZINOF|nr:hypothetical protein ZIOFF_054912 [Zingiber officinale]
MLVAFFAMALWTGGVTRVDARLKVGFYFQSCPHVEVIVKEEIENALRDDEGVGTDLLKMHFHDLLRQGDQSHSSSSSSRQIVTRGLGDNLMLERFDIIDVVKEKLETACRGVVSISDFTDSVALDVVEDAGIVAEDDLNFSAITVYLKCKDLDEIRGAGVGDAEIDTDQNCFDLNHWGFKKLNSDFE